MATVQDNNTKANDGTWFLELVGIGPRPAPHSDNLAALATQADPPPPSPEGPSDDAPVAAAAVAAGLTLGDEQTATSSITSLDTGPAETATGGAGGDAAAPTTPAPALDPEADVLDDWEPADLDRSVRSRRPFRWTVVIAAIVIGGALAAAAILLPQAAERDANALARSYRASLTALRNTLPDTQTALGDLTDPSTTSEQVDAVVPAAAELSGRSADASSLGTDPLPRTLPFLGGPMRGLGPTRGSLVVIGAEGSEIAVRLGRGYVYRTATPALLNTPPLPTQAEGLEIDKLSAELAEALAKTSALVADLPTDAAFTAAKVEAEAASQAFGSWQLAYLTALRDGDASAAATLVADLENQRLMLVAATNQGLLVLRSDLDGRILAVATETEAALANLPR